MLLALSLLPSFANTLDNTSNTLMIILFPVCNILIIAVRVLLPFDQLSYQHIGSSKEILNRTNCMTLCLWHCCASVFAVLTLQQPARLLPCKLLWLLYNVYYTVVLMMNVVLAVSIMLLYRYVCTCNRVHPV